MDVVHALKRNGNTLYGYKGNIVVNQWMNEESTEVDIFVPTVITNMITQYYGVLSNVE